MILNDWPANTGFKSSEIHDTTSIHGRRQKDPRGWHVTLCYKDAEHAKKGTHVTCHGYVKGKDDLEFIEATHAGEKSDSWVKSSGQVVWPSEDELDVAPEIGYSHLETDS